MSDTLTATPAVALDAALAAFQRELPEVRKRNEATVEELDGSLRTYRYAGLPDITAETLPVLGAFGLSFSARPTLLESGTFVLHYELTHELGGRRDGIWPLPDPLDTAPDELGKAIASARRHALTAVTGVAPVSRDDEPASATLAQQRQQLEEAAPAVDDAFVRAAQAATTQERRDAVWAELRDDVQAQRASLATMDAVKAVWLAHPVVDEPEVTEPEAAEATELEASDEVAPEADK